MMIQRWRGRTRWVATVDGRDERQPLLG
jgi:hypothetical protein